MRLDAAPDAVAEGGQGVALNGGGTAPETTPETTPETAPGPAPKTFPGRVTQGMQRVLEAIKAHPAATATELAVMSGLSKDGVK